ncbi:MAG TPA: YciI family protein [Burkholderiales bacterium]|jgi:hypothetical protein
MKVLLLMYQDEKRMRSLPKDEAREVHGAYMAYLGALKEAGVFLANHGLKATTEAKTVRKTGVLNGPFAETKEQLAGYFLLEVPDMEAALSWAKRNPTTAHGSVEVRPVWA